jgi:arabinofuranan 3-O-arabinosyltransferase
MNRQGGGAVSDGASPYRRFDARVWLSPQTLVTVVVVVLVVALNLLQQPGLITFDTKLDLQLDPGGFMSRSLSLWNGDSVVGGLQNQASGYLFPMGPVFWLGHALGVPMWVWERLWSAALMLLAYAGTRRLASHWPGIGPLGAVLAGLTYMLAPRVLTTVGALSGETLPAAVLPWTVLPLVLYLGGRKRRWVAFVLSAATIPWMGGQNATLVVACLVFPALLLALPAGRSLGRRAGDLAGWGGLVAVASLWWTVPLLLLGSYAPPFLDFIESAKDTAGPIGWLSALRGTSHWVALFPGGGRLGWTGGYELASSSWVLVTSVLVAAFGLAGLLRGKLWQRRVLVWSVVVGLAILTAGSGGWAGSVLSHAWLHALDTFLAPLRNIHKFDPVVRLPLALGLGAWATHELPRLWRSSSSRRLRKVAAVTVTAALVLAAAGPALAGSLRTDNGFTDLPDSWRDATAYIADQDQPTRTLVLPGPTFAVQTWGRTIDEPIQVLDSGPWLSRAQLSVAPASTVRLLESLEQSTAEARPQDRVVEALRSLGITDLIIRHDLEPGETDAPDAELARDTITNTPGIRLSATFGKRAGGGPALEVFELNQPRDPRVEVQDWARRAVVSGGPEVVPDVRAAGLVSDDQAVVLATGRQQADVVTDSLRRVERSFGRAYDARSGDMTAHDPYQVDRPLHDYDGDLVPPYRTVARYSGAATFRASSSGGYVDIFGAVRPEQSPYSAFDHSFYTAWQSAPYSRPQGQWVEVTFVRHRKVGTVSLTFDNAGGTPVRKVRVATQNRSVVAEVQADGRVPDLVLDDDSASRLRVTVLDAGSDSGQVRLSDVRISGHDINRALVLPGVVSSQTAVLTSSEPPRRACSVAGDDGSVTCDRSRQRETSETPGFDRDITVGEAGTWHIAGRAIATNGPALDRLFSPLAHRLVHVLATSAYGGDPAVTAANAVDGSPETGWTSAPGDPAPALQLTWGPRRTISKVLVTKATGQPGQLPAVLKVDGGPGTGTPQLVATTGARAGEMRPVRTRQLRVTAVGATSLDGVGISDLAVTGIEDLRYAPDLDGPTGSACGFGPTVEVAGHRIQTRLTGTLGDVRSGAELTVVPCGNPDVHLFAGPHRIRVINPPGFATTSLSLVPPATTLAVPSRQPRVVSWSATERRVEVSADSESALVVNESYNRGWRASVSGVELKPVVLDGWRQGFVLPAGTNGVVKLKYAPEAGFRVALIGGLIMAAVLVVLAMLLLLAQTRAQARRRGRREDVPGPPRLAGADVRPLGRVAQLVIVLALALVSVPLALGALVGRLTRNRHVLHVSAACTAVLFVAALLALGGSPVAPPVGSDVLAALVVGVVCGRVLTKP